MIGSWLTGLRNGAVSVEHIFRGKTSLCSWRWDQSAVRPDQGKVLKRVFCLSNQILTTPSQRNASERQITIRISRLSRHLIILMTIWQTPWQLPGWQHRAPIELVRWHPSLRVLPFKCRPKNVAFRNVSEEKAVNKDNDNKTQYSVYHSNFPLGYLK